MSAVGGGTHLEPGGNALLEHGDAARLWMSTRENPMVITAIFMLDRALGRDDLLELVRSRLLVHDRFRDRIVVPRMPLRKPRWSEEARLSLDEHVQRVELPPDAGPDTLTETVSALASDPLDPRVPGWKITLVDTLGEDGAPRSSALVVRIHHAIADGLALLSVLFGFSDEGAFGLAQGGLPRVGAPGSWRPPRSALFADRERLLRKARSLADLVVRPAEAVPSLSGRLGGDKRLAWTGPLDVERLRTAAHAADAHVNDLVLASLAGALRQFLLRREGLPRTPVHALVPVALPHDGELGNRFASVFITLPVHIASAVERVTAAHHAMRAAKAAAAVSLGTTLVDVASALGGSLERLGVRMLSRKASVVASNVAGPPVSLHLAGRRITSIVYAAPAPGKVALAASAFSYAGELRLTVASDARVLADPAEIARGFEQEARLTTALLTGEAPRTT